MTKDKFLLVSLEEEKAKKLAKVISSETARKILNLLSEKDQSETELSEKLKIPLNTVHYNIQQLEESGLIESKEFKWSEKGKKIRYFKPVNKYIVISPKEKDITSVLKNILPVTLIGTIISGIIYFIQRTSKPMLMKSMEYAQAFDSEAAVAPQEIARNAVASSPSYALYFFIGVLITSFLYLLISYWRYKR